MMMTITMTMTMILFFVLTIATLTVVTGRCSGTVDCSKLQAYSGGGGVCQSCINGQCSTSDCSESIVTCQTDFNCETVPGCSCDIGNFANSGTQNKVIQCSGGFIGRGCEHFITQSECKWRAGCTWEGENNENENENNSGSNSGNTGDNPKENDSPACNDFKYELGDFERTYTENFSSLTPFCECGLDTTAGGEADFKGTCTDQCERCDKRTGNCALHYVTNYFKIGEPKPLGNWSFYIFEYGTENPLKLSLYRRASYQASCTLKINEQNCYWCKTITCDQGTGSEGIEANCSGLHPSVSQEIINTCSGEAPLDTFPYFVMEQSEIDVGPCYSFVGGNDENEMESSGFPFFFVKKKLQSVWLITAVLLVSL